MTCLEHYYHNTFLHSFSHTQFFPSLNPFSFFSIFSFYSFFPFTFIFIFFPFSFFSFFFFISQNIGGQQGAYQQPMWNPNAMPSFPTPSPTAYVPPAVADPLTTYASQVRQHAVYYILYTVYLCTVHCSRRKWILKM
jgi:hypothetical protein